MIDKLLFLLITTSLLLRSCAHNRKNIIKSIDKNSFLPEQIETDIYFADTAGPSRFIMRGTYLLTENIFVLRYRKRIRNNNMSNVLQRYKSGRKIVRKLLFTVTLHNIIGVF